MEIHQLKYFVAVAKEAHFVRAAESVHVTQPTLSQQIQKLEKELGTPLLERSPKKVRLTKAGEKFLPYALNVLDTLNKATQEFHELSTEPKGKLTIGIIPTIGPYLLPRVLKSMRKKAPQLKIAYHELTTSLLIEHLKGGKIDMGVLALPISDKTIAARFTTKEPFYLAVPKKHPLAKKKQVSIKDFSKENILILKEGHCFRDQSLEYCGLNTTNPQITFEGSSLNSVMRLTSAGEGVTFVPHMATSPQEGTQLKFIPFTKPVPTRELGVVWRMITPLNRGQELFMDLVGEELNARGF